MLTSQIPPLSRLGRQSRVCVGETPPLWCPCTRRSLKALCSNEGISFVQDAAVAAGLFTKPATKPVYNSLGEAVEEINRLQSIIKARDAEIEALKNRPYVNLANTNLDTQDDGDLDEAGGSFTTEDTGALSFAEMQAQMNV